MIPILPAYLKRAPSRRDDTKVTGDGRESRLATPTTDKHNNYFGESHFAPRHVALCQLESTVLVSIELLLIYCGSTACGNESPMYRECRCQSTSASQHHSETSFSSNTLLQVQTMGHPTMISESEVPIELKITTPSLRSCRLKMRKDGCL